MAEAKRKSVAIDFADCSGGCNNVEHPTRFFSTQVNDDSVGFTFKKSGLVKQNGAVGLSAATTFTDFLRGLFSHRQFDGTENLYGVSNGQLSLISTSDGSLTSKYYMGEVLNETKECDAYGWKFVCNANSVVKIEGTTAYRVGIEAPTGASAVASAGSGLANGSYSVYVGYARRVGGVNVLYGKGQSLGSVTLGTGSNRITVSFPNSSDPQVNNKVVWIMATTAGELIHYFFYETGNNTTTTFIISSTASKETSIVYEYAAADNGLPPAITFIFSFAGRLWGIIDNIIYYSNDGTYSKYDVERWAAANSRQTSYKLTGIFSVGQHLFFNTDSGILMLPYGDVNQKELLVENRWYFHDMNTVSPWNGGVIGLTTHGVKLFDGQKFTDFDYGYPIRELINKIYTADSNYRPCGFVYRKSFRDEYHLMWQDNTISSNVNNVHAVLNLSSAIWLDFNNYNLAWEFQPISGNYAAVFNNNTLYIGQSHGYDSRIYYETPSTSQVSNVYDSAGLLVASATDKQSYMRSREHVENISGMVCFEKFYCHSVNEKSFEVRICSGDDRNKKTAWITVAPSGGSSVVFPVVFPVAFPSDSAKVTKDKMPSHFWCRSVYVEVRQTANDTKFKLIQLVLFGELEVSNFT